MKYYKFNDAIFAFELDGSQDNLITAGHVLMTSTEIDAHINPPTPQQYKTQFTSIEYLEKFTEEEQIAIVTATTVSIDIKRFYDKMLAANFIDVEDARTIGGLDALITAGLLVAERKAVILAPELIV